VRGANHKQSILVVTTTVDDMVPVDHPIRRIKPVVDEVLRRLQSKLDAMYSKRGRPSVAPERLLKASVLMALYSVRSERLFCDELRFNLLYKWFLGLNVDDLGFDHSTFSKNRTRLLKHRVAEAFFREVYEAAELQGYTSDEHFSVDGSLMQAWASMKSFRPVDAPRGDGNPWSSASGGRNPAVNFRGEARRNDTHRSTTDPEARLARKGRGQPAVLAYQLHALMENRHGLVADLELSKATGRSELDVAADLLKRQRKRKQRTVAGDKGYDNRGFVRACREAGVTPHVAQNTKTPGGSAIDGRTTRHAGYQTSQRRRKRIEEIFGWIKTVGGGRKLRYIGQARNRAWAFLTAATYNLIRMGKLSAQAA
jgi:transposase